jgi:hypothetical protein
MRHAVLHFLVFILLSFNALDAEDSKRTCRILFLDRPLSAPRTMHLFDGTVSREVDLPEMNLSKTYALPLGDISIALLSNPLGKKKQLPAGAPTAIVRAAATDIYLLVMSDPSNKFAPVRIQVVDASMAHFSRGQTLWYNLTELTVGGMLGSSKLVLKPRSQSIMDAPLTEAGYYPVSLAYYKEDKKDIYPICETRWAHDPSSRYISFVIEQKFNRTPRVIVFPDFRCDKSNADKKEK